MRSSLALDVKMTPRRGTRRLCAFGALLLLALVPAAACTSCVAFLGPDNDPARAHPNNVIDRVIYEHGMERADSVSRIIKDEFENYNPGVHSADELKAYLEKFGAQCEERAEIVCAHRGYIAAYVYKYFFDIPMGRRLDTRIDYLVRVTFPKRGDDIIAKMTVEAEETSYIER